MYLSSAPGGRRRLTRRIVVQLAVSLLAEIVFEYARLLPGGPICLLPGFRPAKELGVFLRPIVQPEEQIPG